MVIAWLFPFYFCEWTRPKKGIGIVRLGWEDDPRGQRTEGRSRCQKNDGRPHERRDSHRRQMLRGQQRRRDLQTPTPAKHRALRQGFTKTEGGGGGGRTGPPPKPRGGVGPLPCPPHFFGGGSGVPFPPLSGAFFGSHKPWPYPPYHHHTECRAPCVWHCQRLPMPLVPILTPSHSTGFPLLPSQSRSLILRSLHGPQAYKCSQTGDGEKRETFHFGPTPPSEGGGAPGPKIGIALWEKKSASSLLPGGGGHPPFEKKVFWPRRRFVRFIARHQFFLHLLGGALLGAYD